MHKDNEQLWKVADVAAFTKFSRSWVYKQIGSGTLPYVVVGGRPRFVPSVIREWATREAHAGK